MQQVLFAEEKKERQEEMSNFICDKCGAEIIDSENGYITGCEHWPRKQGRPKGSDKYKEKTEVIRVPTRLVDDIKKYINIRLQHDKVNLIFIDIETGK